VPYDSGQFDTRMGAGPLALARVGAAERLRGQGHAVQEQLFEPRVQRGPGEADRVRQAFRRVVGVNVCRYGSVQLTDTKPMPARGTCAQMLDVLRVDQQLRAQPGESVLLVVAARLNHPRDRHRAAVSVDPSDLETRPGASYGTLTW